MPTSPGDFEKQYDDFVTAFRNAEKLALQGAAAQFRTAKNTESLNATITALAETFKELDAFVTTAAKGSSQDSSVDQAKATQIAKDINARITSLKEMMPIVEGLDEKIILTKTATLDRKNLNAVAAQLKIIDSAFLKNIETMAPESGGDEAPLPVWNINPMDADGANDPNIPEPDEG